MTNSKAQQWMMDMDNRIAKLAEDMGNPVLAKYLKATYASTAEEALKIIERKVELKSQVYFMAEEYEGNGIVYRLDGDTAKVFCPATQKMYTVEISLMEVVEQ